MEGFSPRALCTSRPHCVFLPPTSSLPHPLSSSSSMSSSANDSKAASSSETQHGVVIVGAGYVYDALILHTAILMQPCRSVGGLTMAIALKEKLGYNDFVVCFSFKLTFAINPDVRTYADFRQRIRCGWYMEGASKRFEIWDWVGTDVLPSMIGQYISCE